ncbi:elongation factor P-like protein YeiP [Alloalcanivorax gelatiniphagus]|uniref:Elongation factor P-like protein n=1 Tax=Alloalcanivorax gelatiniphagus TaxID=1194167 RepID=A0ABY2XFM0_9GAMM|nr:elongation factor P-like protein YeiP [Alloalcanivorax gelatiniphagus]TMW10383.1 elongation factor P-like protein YeiP [Alloalcanivorax gelatiniphagus]
MTRASDLKKSDVIEHNGGLFVIRQIDVQSPSARGAATLYRVRAHQVGGGSKFEERYKGDEEVTTVSLQRRPVHFSYVDGDDYVFMDDEDFSQYPIKGDDIADELSFITEQGDGVLALRVGEAVIGLELPASVVLTITETTPAMKAASASARTKPATLETGLVVQVPEYLQEGEKVKINTTERKFMSRA